MGEILDSDWSRRNLLRSDWLPTSVAIMTTLHVENNYTKVVTSRGIFSNFISTNRLNKCKATIMFLITPKRSPFHHLANKACRCPVYKNKVSLGE